MYVYKRYNILVFYTIQPLKLLNKNYDIHIRTNLCNSKLWEKWAMLVFFVRVHAPRLELSSSSTSTGRGHIFVMAR